MTRTLRDADPGLHLRRRKAFLAQIGRPVLVFGMGSALGAGSKSHGGLRYLTGWDGHESASLLVMTSDVARLILSSPFMQPLAAEIVPELDPVYCPAHDWPGLVQAMVTPDVLEMVGIDELPLGIARLFGAAITDAPEPTGILNRMRLIKEPAALDLHRMGAAICDALFTDLPKVLRDCRETAAAQRVLEARALALGAEYCRTWLTVRAKADRPRYWPEETAGTVNTGDQVLMGIALTVDGHWAHGLRMGAIGPMQSDHRRLMAVLEECLRAGLALARPGVAITDLADAMETTFSTGTAGLDLREAQRFRFGHGLGLSYEDPILTDAFGQSFGVAMMPARAEGAGGVLAPGMVLELHPNLFLPGIGGAALGEMVIISETGAERPIRHPLTPMLV